MVPTTVWRALAEKFWLACFAAGIFFMIVGATGTVPFVSPAKIDLYFQIILFGGGVVVFGFGMYAGWAAKEVLPNKTQGGEGRKQTLNPKTYDVRITSPKEGAKIGSSALIQGTIKTKLGSDMELWLINEGDVAGEVGYWPQERVHPDRKNKWAVTYTPAPGYKDGDRRKLHLFLVGPDGKILVTAFKKTHRTLASPQKLPWVGLTRLTSDMVQACAPIQCTLIAPKPPES